MLSENERNPVFGHSTGCGWDRENSKVLSESEEQMQDIIIKEACP